jgi:hypothetical protein
VILRMFICIFLMELCYCFVNPRPMFMGLKADGRMYFSTHCIRNSIEESLAKRLNLSILDGHDNALYTWLDNGIHQSGTKFTLIHFDSREI